MTETIVSIDINSESSLPIPDELTTTNYLPLLVIVFFFIFLLIIIIALRNRVISQRTPLADVSISNNTVSGFFADDIGWLSVNDLNNQSCPYGWTGKNCQIEGHTTPFWAVGNISSFNIPEQAIMTKTFANAKSFSFDETPSCSDLCNDQEDCGGFFYQDHHCYLLNRVDVLGHLSFNPKENPNLYVKRGRAIVLHNRLFLHQGRANLPSRYWRAKEIYQRHLFAEIPMNTILQIDFKPLNFRNHFSSFTGIISPYRFTLAEVPYLINNIQRRYLIVNISDDVKSGEITLPERWRKKTRFYVYFML